MPSARCSSGLKLKCAPAGVIISNHVSWADILVHLEGHFCSFVARSNTQDMPLIGLIRCAVLHQGACTLPRSLTRVLRAANICTASSWTASLRARARRTFPPRQVAAAAFCPQRAITLLLLLWAVEAGLEHRLMACWCREQRCR